MSYCAFVCWPLYYVLEISCVSVAFLCPCIYLAENNELKQLSRKTNTYLFPNTKPFRAVFTLTSNLGLALYLLG